MATRHIIPMNLFALPHIGNKDSAADEGSDLRDGCQQASVHGSIVLTLTANSGVGSFSWILSNTLLQERAALVQITSEGIASGQGLLMNARWIIACRW